MGRGNFHERITSKKEVDVFEGISNNLLYTLYSRGGYGIVGPQVKSKAHRPGSSAAKMQSKTTKPSKPTMNTTQTQSTQQSGNRNRQHRSRSIQDSAPKTPKVVEPLDALAIKKKKNEELDRQMRNEYGARSKLFDYEIALMSRQNRRILVLNKNDRVRELAEREKIREAVEEEKKKKKMNSNLNNSK
jgi:hypothetical protein